MIDTMLSEYFYGDESGQFNYFRIPCLLITSPRFKHVSTDAKLLYGMLLDRMSLSEKNNWYDDDGRVFIYYTVEEICEDMNCGRDKAMKLLAELDTKKGVSLVERVRQGQGKPTKLYVRRFTTREIPPNSVFSESVPIAPVSEVDISDVQRSEIPTSRSRENRCPEVGKIDPNHIKINQTDFIQPNLSIYHPQQAQPVIDRVEFREQVKRKIDYERLRQKRPYDDVESLLELIVEVVSSTSTTMRISGELLPTETVKQRFWQLDGSHVEYVIDCLKQTNTKINNIRAYLLTALYHAPVTIGPYYSAAVRHDFG